jgi:hypothetical protein
MKKNREFDQTIVEKRSADPGAVEDIYELKYRDTEPKSGPIAGTENQINTVGATSSTPDEQSKK